MSSTIQKIKERILRLETELNEAKIGLKVAESVEDNSLSIVPLNSPDIVKNEDQSSARQQIIKDIKEFNGKLSTNGIIQSYMKRMGMTDRRKAGRRIYPVLTDLKNKEMIEAYKKDPKSTGSLWRIKVKSPE